MAKICFEKWYAHIAFVTSIYSSEFVTKDVIGCSSWRGCLCLDLNQVSYPVARYLVLWPVKRFVFWDVTLCGIEEVSWCFRGASIDSHKTTQHYIPENELYNNCCEDLTSNQIAGYEKLWMGKCGFAS